MKKLLTMTFIAIVLVGCNDVKTSLEVLTDKSEKYTLVDSSLIGNGTHRTQVLVLMGTPVLGKAHSVAGLDGESLSFTDSHSTYQFWMINNRVVSKSQSPKTTISSTK